jgi:hypothetical protein
MLPLFVGRELNEGESLVRLIYPPKLIYWLSVVIPLLVFMFLVFLWWLFWRAGAVAQIFWLSLMAVDLLIMWRGVYTWKHEVLVVTSRRFMYFSGSFFKGPIEELDRNIDWSLEVRHSGWLNRLLGYWLVKIKAGDKKIEFLKTTSEDKQYLERLF